MIPCGFMFLMAFKINFFMVSVLWPSRTWKCSWTLKDMQTMRHGNMFKCHFHNRTLTLQCLSNSPVHHEYALSGNYTWLRWELYSRNFSVFGFSVRETIPEFPKCSSGDSVQTQDKFSTIGIISPGKWWLPQCWTLWDSAAQGPGPSCFNCDFAKKSCVR